MKKKTDFKKIIVLLSSVAVAMFILSLFTGFRFGVTTLSQVDSDIIFIEYDGETATLDELDKIISQSQTEQLFDKINPDIVKLEACVLIINADPESRQKCSGLTLIDQVLSLFDTTGAIIDLATIQSGLSVVTSYDADVDAIGTMQTWLDDKMISEDKIYVYMGGVHSKRTVLNIDNEIKPIGFRHQAKTFTFSDEGETWHDKEKHHYRIIIKDITVWAVSQDGKKKTYQFEGEFIAYDLEMVVDGTKKTILGENNEAIAVFKLDSSLSRCAQFGEVSADRHGGVRTGLTTQQPPMYAYDANGKLLAENIGEVSGTQKTDPLRLVHTCITITGVPRNTDIKLVAGNKEFFVKTPLTESVSYIINCHLERHCESNFGWEN